MLSIQNTTQIKTTPILYQYQTLLLITTSILRQYYIKITRILFQYYNPVLHYCLILHFLFLQQYYINATVHCYILNTTSILHIPIQYYMNTISIIQTAPKAGFWCLLFVQGNRIEGIREMHGLTVHHQNGIHPQYCAGWQQNLSPNPIRWLLFVQSNAKNVLINCSPSELNKFPLCRIALDLVTQKRNRKENARKYLVLLLNYTSTSII